MIATLNKRQNRIGHRRSTTWVQRAANAAFQFAHCLLEGKVGIGSATTIKQLAVRAIGGGKFLSFTVSNTSEEARWITGFTAPWV